MAERNEPRLCSDCGTAKACNCNAPYITAIEYAVKALAANPELSDRALAAKIGVSHQTIGRARATGPDGPVNEETAEKRIGLDGKPRKTPKKKPRPPKPYVNPITRAWMKASAGERREFVRDCWAYITQVRNQLDSNGHLHREEHEQEDRWIEE